MKNSYKYILLAIIAISFAACDTADVELTTDTVVVDAYLFANQGIDSIRITKSISYSDTAATLVAYNDLDVTITTDNQVITLSSIGGGYYQNLNEIVQSEKTYELSFEHKGQTISAFTYIPAKKDGNLSVDEISLEKIEIGTMPTFTQVDPIEVSWNNDEGDYYYVVVQNIEDDPIYVNERLATGGGGNRPFRFISEPSIMDAYNIDPRREIQQFGVHQIIIYRVNPEYAALYATSGTTSSTIAQPPTNIENGLGIFTGVSSDTLYLDVKEL